MSDPLPTSPAVGALGRDFGCPRCGCAHRFACCDRHPECPPHPFDDDVEP